MTIKIAEKTLAAIASSLAKDQGSLYRQCLQKVLPHITDAYRGDEDGFRTHLGASIIGRECQRAIWYSYRAVKLPKFDGRMIRLFNRGHLEEGRFIALLMMIGATIYQQDANGKQLRFSEHFGHFGGSCDSVVIGIPDLDPGLPVLTEYKTHNTKSFTKLKTEGMRKSKPEHYIQMNLYMHKFQLTHGLYMAVNKDNDELYGEIIEYDQYCAWFNIDKAKNIIYSRVPPARISKSPAFFQCVWCEFKVVCHKQKGVDQTVEKNCRTCEYSAPHESGNWICHLHHVLLDKDEQLKGCSSHSIIKEI